ncbi:MAG: DUF3429 domain-containing protein [Rhodomicrobium sp.]|nr:DUF3429 domain-containing protein [Rhodomicrobium sp.]
MMRRRFAHQTAGPATAADGAPALRGLPQSAAVLAYAGALPLIIAALLIVVSPEAYGGAARAFMIIYGGALIAFFGGVRWGVAVMRPEGPTFRSLIGGALPFAAALPLFYPGDAAMKFVLILIALPILLIDDLAATRRGSGAPDWYLGARAPLTILMEFSYLVALAQTLKG